MTTRSDSADRPAHRGMIRKFALIALCAVVLAAVAGLGWIRYRDASAANDELALQKGEIEECKARLASFYQAWKHYQADHKGQQPRQYEDLVPAYIKDPASLMCPTAARWRSKGTALQAGYITLNNKNYPESYGFLAFAASYPMEAAKHGDSTVIVTCSAHQEAMYRAVYHRAPPISVFETSERAGLPDAVRSTQQIVLRKNGVIDTQAASQ
jgi:hypothetical protein